MSMAARDLVEHYTDALRQFLGTEDEGGLLDAYEFGCRAIAEQRGVLEMATVHGEALVTVLLDAHTPENSVRIAEAAEEFFSECITPFDRLLSACPLIRWKVLVALAVTTGMRRREMLALQWKDLDLEEGLVRDAQARLPFRNILTDISKSHHGPFSASGEKKPRVVKRCSAGS